MDRFDWSPSEKKAARIAFDKAARREESVIAAEVQRRCAAADEPQWMWRLHDYLDEQRREFDRKYDYRYSVLPLLFVRLRREGWLEQSDLAGLAEEKRLRIEELVRVSQQMEAQGRNLEEDPAA